MTQKDKDLQLKDICARLPYGLKCRFGSNSEITTITTIDITNGAIHNTWAEPHPYLRPLESMTKDEIAEFKWLSEQCDAMPTFEYISIGNYRLFDWLNRKMFDYRGMIPQGLALVAPKGMYD